MTHTCTPQGETGGCAAASVEGGPEGTVEKSTPTAAAGTLYTGAPEALARDADGKHLRRRQTQGPLPVIESTPKANRSASSAPAGAHQLGRRGPTGNALALDEGPKPGGNAPRPSTPPARAPTRRAPCRPSTSPKKARCPRQPGARRDLLPTEATLAATLNPENAQTTYHFEYGTPLRRERSRRPTKPRPRTGRKGGELRGSRAQAAVSGLIPDTTYHFRLCASNTAGENCGPDTTFATRTAVGIEAQWVSALSAHEATLDATLDPLGAENAAWWVEYDTSPYGEGEAGHGTRTPEPPAAIHGPPASRRTTHWPGPDTTYHYRFVAKGDQEGHPYTVHGPDQSFATQPAGLGLSLPDNRAWEMVSPSDKHGARLPLPRSGAGGGRRRSPRLPQPRLGRSRTRRQPQPRRHLGAGQAHGTGAVGLAGHHAAQCSRLPVSRPRIQAVLSGLAEALLEPRSGTPLAPSASERTPYLRRNSEPPIYTPLVSGCPPAGEPCPPAVAAEADVSAGIEFGDDPASPEGAGAVADRRPLPRGGRLNGVAAPEGTLAEPRALYELTRARGRLAPLSLPPEDEVAVNAQLGSGAASARGAISVDGSRVFFSTPALADPTGLYVRDTALGQTVHLDEELPGAFGTGEAQPLFQGASADGSVAFFTDTQNLTEDANESGADLYRCALRVDGGELKCDLTDITAQTHNPADLFESAEVQGLLSGMSEDATRLYLVARGVLDATANPQGESAVPGQPNLYLWRRGEGARFIATLSEEDRHDWGVLKPGPAGRPALRNRLPRVATSPSCPNTASPATTTATR